MRALSRLVSALLALAVAGAGGLTAAEVLIARVHWGWLPDPPLVVPYNTWLRELRAHNWSQDLPLWGSIGGIVVGLLLLLLAARSHERRVPLQSSAPDVHMTTSRRSLAHVLSTAAKQVEAVSDARASVGRTTARVRATLRLGDPDEVRERVRAAAQSRLDGLPLARRPRLVVSINDGRRYR